MFLSALSALVVFDFLELGINNIALIRLFRLGFSTLGSGGRTFSLLRAIRLMVWCTPHARPWKRRASTLPMTSVLPSKPLSPR